MAIDIVTAFFDIGREDWAQRADTPAWLARSTEDYFACFERMCRLENEIVVFTQSRFADRIAGVRAQLGFSNQTRIVCKDDLFEEYGADLGKITRVMNLPGFLKGVTHPHCPEYWEPRYVLINYLKSFFASEAIDQSLARSEFLAWVDFGYCRDENVLPASRKWDYPFADKIHLFNIEKLDSQDLVSIIKTNKVYFTGGAIVASPSKWRDLKRLMQNAFDMLISYDLIDDDQTLLLMAYRNVPQFFETHFVDAAKGGWFVLFKDYNAPSPNQA
ncbi:MAG TPA: WlaTC/HtrL family glycosyltransferase [Micropepsaceae bacterium]|nr:WlaTC/HtrL family glycosyltransferase [Micropepsaceae bacterium]